MGCGRLELVSPILAGHSVRRDGGDDRGNLPRGIP